MENLVLWTHQNDISLPEQFGDKLEFSVFRAYYYDHYPLKLMLSNLHYSAVSKVFSKRHAEGRRDFRLLKRVRG